MTTVEAVPDWLRLGRQGRRGGDREPTCRVCLEQKPLEEFRKKPSSGAYVRTCIECEAQGKTVRLTDEQVKTNLPSM
jgi:hypothetical protein